LKDKLDRLAEAAGKTINLELLVKMVGDAPELEMPAGKSGLTFEKPEAKARIAVAMDSAFNFYYRDNLELLEAMGAELFYFSPLKDSRLPEGIDGVYLGGGYPEIFAEELSQNRSIRNDIRSKLKSGLPAYAECGGLMYLCRTLRDMEGNVFKMAGVFPAQCKMTSSLQWFGYAEVKIAESCTLGEPGYTTRANEFHYSTVNMEEGHEKLDIRNCYEVLKRKRKGEDLRWKDGW
jgi:cobyrinic acid a,c-diamide synthase